MLIPVLSMYNLTGYMKMLENILNWLPENNRIERIWLMAKFDFVTRYYGSFLGLFWALLKPLFQLLIYYFVFTVIFKNSTEHFLMFLFVGIILFQFFTEAAAGSLKIFQSKRYLLENIQINRLDIFYAAICATFIGFLFNFIAFSVGNLFLNDSFSWSILLFPLVIVNLVVLILAAQLILSTISIFLKDIDNIWFLVTTLLFWGSGIFFDLNELTGKAALIMYFNPLAGILTNARSVLVYAEPLNINLFLINFSTSIIFLLIGLWLFKNYSSKALEKI